MAEFDDSVATETAYITLGDVDLASLVGHEIVLYTDQFRGQPLRTKVVMVSQHILSVDRSGSNGMVDSLINNQRTIVQFAHRGQRISVNAILKRSTGGKCSLVLSDKLVPLSRRRFKRYELTLPVKCAAMPSADVTGKSISKLRWLQTDSINFSSGGLLLCLPKQLINNSYLFLNIDINEFTFPTLLIGQVRYSYPIDKFRFNIGIEFIVGDAKEKHFAPSTIQGMPPVVFEYTASRRKELNRELAVRMQKLSKQEL